MIGHIVSDVMAADQFLYIQVCLRCIKSNGKGCLGPDIFTAKGDIGAGS